MRQESVSWELAVTFPDIKGYFGIVMYGRPRCCKGKTDLKRR